MVFLGERGYRVIEVRAADIETNLAVVLEEVACAISP